MAELAQEKITTLNEFMVNGDINTDSKITTLDEFMSDEKAAYEREWELEFRRPTGDEREATKQEVEAMRADYHKRLVEEYPNDYYSGVPADLDALAAGFLDMRPKEFQRPGTKEANPVATAMGQLSRLITVGWITGGVAPAVTKSQALSALPTITRIVAGRMAQSGATFSLSALANHTAEYVSGEKKDFKVVAKDVMKEGAFGAGLGAVGSIASPLMRIPAEAAYGFATSKMQGATNLEAGMNGAMFMLFGLFNTKNLSEQYKLSAYNGAKKAMTERLVREGLDPERAKLVSERYMQWATHKSGGFSSVSTKDYDAFSKGMRKGYKIYVEPEVNAANVAKGKELVPAGKAGVKPEVAPKPQEGGGIDRAYLQKTLGKDAGEIIAQKELSQGIKNIEEIPPHYKIDLESKTTRGIIDSFKESIKKGEKIPPIVLDEAGKVVDGAHRLQAYKELGIKEIPIIQPSKLSPQAGGQKPPVEPPKTEIGAEEPATKPSGVALSVKAKALEKGLAEDFGELAQYTPTTLKEQAEKATKLFEKDIDKVRRIIRGEEELPEGILGGTMIKAAQQYAVDNGDPIMLKELANSPLVSEKSVHAQELGSMRGRDPNSPLVAIQDINKARMKKAGVKEPIRVKKAEVKKMRAYLKKTSPTGDEWAQFMKELQC